MAQLRYGPAYPAPLKILWPVLGLGLGLTVLTAWPGAGIGLRGWRPEWPLLLTVYLSLRTETPAACTGAFGLGLFQNYTSLAPGGLFSLKLMLGVLITRLLIRKLEFERTSARILLVLGLHLTLTAGLEQFLLNLVQPNPRHPYLSRETLILIARTGLVSALAASPLFGLLDRLLGPKDKDQ
jgi:rod shape-determining protein MreD